MCLNNLVLGLQKDTGDARAFSFLQILELIPFLLQPPSMLFVENVVGFEVCVLQFNRLTKTLNKFHSWFLIPFLSFLAIDIGYACKTD